MVRLDGGTRMIGRLNHVAIAVPDVKAAALYRDVLAPRCRRRWRLPAHGVTTVFVSLANTKIELLEPLGDESPVKPFLARNPAGGMHHVCYEVADIRAARDRLVARARACWATASPRSAPMASRCCSCIPRISAAR